MKTPLSLALTAALFAMPISSAFAQDEAAAEEESSRLSWNLALTSNYMFRGADLNDDKPALQGGVDFALDHGIYVGLWGSNVDFGTGGPDTELDTYVGWSKDLSDDWNLDLMATRYNYFGERDGYGSVDYNEYFARLTYGGFVTFTYAYTDSYSNSGEDGMYFALSASKEIGHGLTLDTNVGLSTFDDDLGYKDYMDYSVGVSRQFGPVNASLMYTGVDGDGEYNWGSDGAEDKLVLTFKIEG